MSPSFDLVKEGGREEWEEEEGGRRREGREEWEEEEGGR